MDTLMTIQEAAKLDHALRENGWTTKDVKELVEGKFLKQFREVLAGYAEIKAVKHVINCDASPFVTGELEVFSHKKGGQLEWNPARISIYSDEIMEGNNLRKKLEDMPVLNDTVLDYLLAHKRIIPDSWKGKKVFFWGTIYRSISRLDNYGCLYVYYLFWNDNNNWDWGIRRLNRMWGKNDAAAILLEN